LVTKIVRVGSAAAAAAGAILATGAFALAPASTARTARSVSHARTASATRGIAGAWTASAARPAASTGHVLPGQPMIPAGRAGQQSPAAVSGALAVTRSFNWAGYTTTKGGRSFGLVQATFFVPYLNCAVTPSTYSAHWVGLDGFAKTADSVEQDGIEADCAGSAGRTPSYRAWYEMFPKPEAVSTIKVRPGDSITASVSYSPASRKFRLTVADNTNGRRFSVAKACAARRCPRTSTEAISEAPSNSKNQLLPLADYGAVGFTNIAITDGAGHRGGLISRLWRTTKILQYGAASRRLIAQPTATHASGFANYWLGEN
jgi:Peptidase A4 family